VANDNCKTCNYFWIQSNAQMGSCRRYPTYQNRHSTEWCGEFSALKHYDLPDTIENLVIADENKEQVFIKTLDKAIGNEPKNKGGRPRKVSRI